MGPRARPPSSRRSRWTIASRLGTPPAPSGEEPSPFQGRFPAACVCRDDCAKRGSPDVVPRVSPERVRPLGGLQRLNPESGRGRLLRPGRKTIAASWNGRCLHCAGPRHDPVRRGHGRAQRRGALWGSHISALPSHHRPALAQGRRHRHPALSPLLPLWKEGTLAAVQAVGSPDPTRSHFDAQDFMESGTPGVKATEDGWINRHLQATPSADATPFRAVSLTPTLPRSLAGRAPAVAMNSIREFDLRPSAGASVAHGFEGMYETAVNDVLHGTGQETFEAVQFLKKSDPSRYAPAAGVECPRGRYGDAMTGDIMLVENFR